ncbi:hypothetical protein GCM10010462_10670 [Microbacterium dextranolyticum]|uniref:Ribbon-helix-helix protein CopG domain-containing protein n=1 Tax=Microbacterium dextranolyticum TaxID=36806 RepID=A0A9W6HK25_9MICO|nr:hypothetical protein GCM10017591_02570 [Microbacterium dextranolyticum]
MFMIPAHAGTHGDRTCAPSNLDTSRAKPGRPSCPHPSCPQRDPSGCVPESRSARSTARTDTDCHARVSTAAQGLIPLDARVAREHKSRSELIREAIAAHAA